MGNGNSSTIAINLDRLNSFYHSDEPVSGTVDLNVMKSKTQADDICITLTGEIGYTTIQTMYNGTGGAVVITNRHHVPFYSTTVVLTQTETGQKELVYDQGQYFWPFQIPLTDHLPPTMNEPQAFPHVRYYLRVVIDKPWYKPNKRKTKYFTVFPHVNLLQNPQCLVSTIFENHNRKGVNLKGTLNKLGYVPGELIGVTLEIENPRRVLIQRITLSMIQSYKIGENSRGYRTFERTLPKIVNLKDEQTRETFSVMIPDLPFPPSYHFQSGVYVHIHYLLKFAVKVKGMFTNFDIDIPITLGTEPYPDQNQQQTFNPLIVSYSSNHEETMFNDDAPPSYDSVVQNKK